jgi:hypothetical protein
VKIHDIYDNFFVDRVVINVSIIVVGWAIHFRCAALGIYEYIHSYMTVDKCPVAKTTASTATYL